MITLSVKVKPGSRCSELIPGEGENTWIARLKSPPVDGKANQELIGLIASQFSCAKKCVTIRHGGASRTKLVQVDTG